MLDIRFREAQFSSNQGAVTAHAQDMVARILILIFCCEHEPVNSIEECPLEFGVGFFELQEDLLKLIGILDELLFGGV